VQFKIDRWVGNAGALDLDVKAEQLRLYDNVDATMQPADATDTPMNIKAHESIMRRKENDVAFTTNVVMTRDTEKLVSDHAVAHFTADRKTLIGVEGEGHVDITALDDAAGSGRKEITCDRFWSEVANNQISAIHAVGEQAPTHAVIEGPPKRDLVAREIRIGLTNKQVSDIRA